MPAPTELSRAWVVVMTPPELTWPLFQPLVADAPAIIVALITRASSMSLDAALESTNNFPASTIKAAAPATMGAAKLVPAMSGI